MPQSTTNWYDVRNFGNNIQAAINAAVGVNNDGGGVVYIPAGVYPITSPLVIPANSTTVYPPGITLLGDGPTVSMITMNIQPPTQQVDILRIQRNYTHIEGIGFQGAQVAGNGRGVVVGATGLEIRRVSMQRCTIRATGSYALHILGAATSPGTRSIFGDFVDCDLSSNLGGGALLFIESECTTQRFRGCTLWSFVDHAAKLVGCDTTSFVDCSFEAGSNSQPYVYATQSIAGLLQHCYFEDVATSQPPTPNWFVFLDAHCHGWTVDSCTFRRRSLAGNDPRAIAIGNTTSAPRSVLVQNPHMLTAAGTPGATNYILLTGAQTECHLIGGIAQGPTGASTTPIRLLDPTTLSTTWGGTQRARIPRLTLAEINALPTPDVGQMVYNTTSNKFNVWTPGGWKGVSLTTP